MGQKPDKSPKPSQIIAKTPTEKPVEEIPTPKPMEEPIKSKPLKESPKPIEEPLKSKPVKESKPQKEIEDNPETELEHFFATYRDTEQDQIRAGGIEKFCNDLQVEPTDFIVLAIAWKFEAKQMCLFTREEFMNGCRSLKVYNLKEFKKALPNLRSEFKNKTVFKELYYFTFDFGLEEGQRILPLDMAIPLWECVFSGAPEKPKILGKWLSFLKQLEGNSISKDTWKMFYHFLENVRPDLSNYDDADAWPCLFDDFFEFEKEKNTKTA